jgi:hypothetical protein
MDQTLACRATKLSLSFAQFAAAHVFGESLIDLNFRRQARACPTFPT